MRNIVFLRDTRLDVVPPAALSLREMLRKYLQTGEMPELMSDAEASYDFPSVDKVDMNAELVYRSDLTDFIHSQEKPQQPLSALQEPVSSVSNATSEEAAPSANLTNGAD